MFATAWDLVTKTLVTYFPVNEHLVCFQFLAITNISVPNILPCVGVETGKFPKVYI